MREVPLRVDAPVHAFPDRPALAVPQGPNRAAARRGVPVVLHAGRRAPGATAADEIAALAPLLAAHPTLPLVLAHAGYPHAGRTLQLMAQYANLYADVTPVWEQRVGVGAAEL